MLCAKTCTAHAPITVAIKAAWDSWSAGGVQMRTQTYRTDTCQLPGAVGNLFMSIRLIRLIRLRIALTLIAAMLH